MGRYRLSNIPAKQVEGASGNETRNNLQCLVGIRVVAKRSVDGAILKDWHHSPIKPRNFLFHSSTVASFSTTSFFRFSTSPFSASFSTLNPISSLPPSNPSRRSSSLTCPLTVDRSASLASNARCARMSRLSRILSSCVRPRMRVLSWAISERRSVEASSST